MAESRKAQLKRIQLLEGNISALVRVLSLTQTRNQTKVAEIHIHLLEGWKNISSNLYCYSI